MLIEQQRQKVVILTTPTSMVAPQAFVMATRGATSYDKAVQSPHSDYKGTGHCAWWQSCKFCNQTHRGVQKLENECYKTNQYLCSIPGHATQASADFVGYTWHSAYLPQARFLTNKPWCGWHVAIFCTAQVLTCIVKAMLFFSKYGKQLLVWWILERRDSGIAWSSLAYTKFSCRS